VNGGVIEKVELETEKKWKGGKGMDLWLRRYVGLETEKKEKGGE
jgi:hypothetical protein